MWRMPRTSKPRTRKREPVRPHPSVSGRLVIITGMSGSGKASVLKAFEDLGYYSVDNLPVELIQHLADLLSQTEERRNAALVVDIREGERLEKLPEIFRALRQKYNATLVYLEAKDDILLRRYSETRRPHPLGISNSVQQSLTNERKRLAAIRKVADIVIDTSKFNVHELRAHIHEAFKPEAPKPTTILVSTISFGFKKGVPDDADLMFDVRFLPNPHFVPELRPYTGRHPKVARYIRSFPQTQEFIDRISDLLVYLLPHYIEEGKSYLTIAFGCTGGQHRSVMIAEEVSKRLGKAGFRVKVEHRDCPR
jgi:RNase adapter protein RapZ